MRIVQPQQHAVLAFIEACNRSGYRPSAEEVRAWIDSPMPRAGYSKHHPDSITGRLAKFGQMVGQAFGPPGEWVPGENALDHLLRILWLKHEGNGITLTRLGEAMLTEATRVRQADETAVVVLRSTDRFAYARLIGQVASAGSAFLVDPYFRLPQLETIFDSTQVARVLISKQYKGSTQVRAELAVALSSLTDNAGLEIRATADQALHDRVLIAENGDVFLLGASLNTVGVGNTVFMRVPDPAATALKAQAEDLWEAAEVVGRTNDEPDIVIEDGDPMADPDEPRQG